MNELDGAVWTYIMAVKNTETYQNYARERDRIRQNPELKAQIDDFRRRNYELQISADTDFHQRQLILTDSMPMAKAALQWITTSHRPLWQLGKCRI